MTSLGSSPEARARVLDTAYDGFSNLDFAPSARVAVSLERRWAVALQEYADFGPLEAFAPLREQSHQIYGVVDWSGAVDVEAGVGFGLTAGSDDLTFKLILSRDLNRR